jgi:hypothetical protein
MDLVDLIVCRSVLDNLLDVVSLDLAYSIGDEVQIRMLNTWDYLGTVQSIEQDHEDGWGVSDFLGPVHRYIVMYTTPVDMAP